MIAIIDIGSNSVRLMLWADGKSLYKRVETTRLGEGIARSPFLLPAAIERTAQAVRAFKEEAEGLGAKVYAFATAAVRSAENGGEFCARVRTLCNLEVDVVSGKDEALLGRVGALWNEEGGIIDVGGASSEISFGKGKETFFSVSLDVGAVRLHDSCGQDRDKLLSAVSKHILGLNGAKTAGKTYIIGGTASTLACLKLGLVRYDSAALQNLPISAGEIQTLVDRLFAMGVEERKALKGMDAKRADIIAGGALLLLEIMKKLSLSTVYFSDMDNMEGYLILRGLA